MRFRSRDMAHCRRDNVDKCWWVEVQNVGWLFATRVRLDILNLLVEGKGGGNGDQDSKATVS